ncbi:30S ribosomal protein S8 [Guyparkeria sp. SCN-R1]|uniref:30S ribosomal protein S8 n=1 Tax=Guyparkeria sp. SCN-R1 TaxID=2341113 RepID=UPI000F64977E|nr:30S ribosomal protein S8 [Guyparkeria sp. SCN-R1]RRQ23250.1 30S ribosomal protein S8 [Guyparkeria sp. SCN-R1]
MSMNDPIADMLTRIRNGQAARKPEVRMPASKFKKAVAETLKDEGYIADIRVEGDKKPTLVVTLRYFEGKPVIEKLNRVSRPGSRKFFGAEDLPQVLGGLGVAVVSTSEGVMPDREARRRNIGGEVVCFVS